MIDLFETDSVSIEVFTDPHLPPEEQNTPHGRFLRIALGSERGSGQFTDMCACCAREFHELLGKAIACAERAETAAPNAR